MKNLFKKVLCSIGIALLTLGAFSADSPSLLAPFTLIIPGALLVYFTWDAFEKRGGEYED